MQAASADGPRADTMPLDPQAKDFLDRAAAQAGPPLSSLTPRVARLQMEAGTPLLGPPDPVARLEDHTIPGPRGAIRLRLTAPAGTGPRPALVYFHGGGWVTGSIETHDALCRAIANASGVAVISVDYRLAPEHPFPAPADDAYAATCWVVEQARALGLDPDRIAVGGDSAGGNLAAVVALKAREAAAPRLAFQLLIYPITDHDLDTPSYRENAEGYMLTRADMAWFWDHHVRDEAGRRHPHASPYRADDLSALPPALVLTAGYDPLRDEGEAYARRLEEAGVPVELVRYPGMIHGFLRRYRIFDQGRDALATIAEALRRALR